MRTELAAAAERAKQAVRMRERADQRLGIENLRARDARLGVPSGRWCVMVWLPIQWPCACACSARRRRSGIGELRAEDEEGRGDLRSLQDFQDLLGDAGLGPVVEGA